MHGQTSTGQETARNAGGPLAGVVVLDMTRVLAGPFCTLVLASLGARVIKLEQPETGEDSRRFGPFVNGESAYFMSLNHGKESIALDLKTPEGRDLFERLLARSDVLVENFRPGTLARLGYDWPTLHAHFPRLVYAACSGFGHTGSYWGRPAYDMVVQAMGGIMSITGEPGGAPVRVGTSIGDITAGLFTVIGIQAALWERATTGLGQMVDVAMLDCQVAILENAIARYAATGEAPGPMGSRHPSITPFEAYRAADGHVIIAAGNDALFGRLAAALGRPELAHDARFRSNGDRVAHADALKAEIEAVLAGGTVASWLDRLQQAGVPCGPINDIPAVLADPHVRARNMIATFAGGPNAGFAVAGNPIKLSGHPDRTEVAPAPAVDADRERILQWLDGN
jgi:CoA:oxalate CoA-transferase